MARSSIYPPSVQPGKPHLGEAPPGWKTYRFADLFEVVERPAALRDDEEYQLITAKRSRGGVVARERLLGRDILTKTQFYVAEDDFVISNRQIIHGGCGIVPAALDGAIVSNEYTVLRPKPVLLLDYLRYLPHTIYFQQTCFHASVGVDVEKMVFDLDQWLGLSCHLPLPSEQQAISEILTSLDATIEYCASHIAQARRVSAELLASILKVRRINPGQKLEPGCVPDGWSIDTLGKVGNWLSGGTPPRSRSDYWSGSVPWVSPKDMKSTYILSTIEQISENAAHDLTVVPPGTLLIVVRGMILQKTVPVCITAFDCAFNQDVKALLANNDYLPEFVRIWLDYQRPYLAAIVDTATHGTKKLPMENFVQMPIPKPPIVEQDRMVEKAKELECQVRQAENVLNAHIALRQGMLSKLLTGCLRVGRL